MFNAIFFVPQFLGRLLLPPKTNMMLIDFPIKHAVLPGGNKGNSKTCFFVASKLFIAKVSVSVAEKGLNRAFIEP